MDLSPPITPADLKLILLPQKLTTSTYSTIWTGQAVRESGSQKALTNRKMHGWNLVPCAKPFAIQSIFPNMFSVPQY